MTEKRLIPAKETQIEFKIANSRFITTAGPSFSVDQAKEFIQQIKQRYADASHNVPVFIIGHGASTTEHSSDDGEPSGTAGRPALAGAEQRTRRYRRGDHPLLRRHQTGHRRVGQSLQRCRPRGARGDAQSAKGSHHQHQLHFPL